MKTKSTTVSQTKDLLSQAYYLKQLDLDSDARLARKGFVFETEAYDIAALGHLCVMRMKALLGLMQMETAILSVTHKDVQRSAASGNPAEQELWKRPRVSEICEKRTHSCTFHSSVQRGKVQVAGGIMQANGE